MSWPPPAQLASQTSLEQVPLTPFALFIKSCILPHSALTGRGEQSSSPGEYLPFLMSSSNSLPESYFFNKCLFPALCVPSSQQLKCNIEQKRVSVLQCNKTLLPLATETPPRHWWCSGRKLQVGKNSKHGICGKWQKYIFKVSVLLALKKNRSSKFIIF